MNAEQLIRRAQNLAQTPAPASSSSKWAPKASLERMASKRRTLSNPTRACAARHGRHRPAGACPAGALPREIAVESVPNKVTRYDRVSTPTTIANLTISSRNMGSVVASLFKRIFDLYRGRTRTYRIVIGYCIYTRSDDGSYEEFSNIARYRVLNSVLRIRNTVPRSNGSQFSNYSTE